MAGGANILAVQDISPLQAQYIPTSFGENLSASLMSSAYASKNALPSFDYYNDRSSRDTLIEERFGRDLLEEADKYAESLHPFSITDAFGIPGIYDPAKETAEQRRTAREQYLTQRIEQGREENPQLWGDVRTDLEMWQEIKRRAKFVESTQAQVSARAETAAGRYGGAILGGIAGAFTDPVNVATLPLGAVSGMRTLTAVGTEVLVNAAIEATQQPSYLAWQKELGNDVDINDAILNVFTAGAGAGVLSGLVRGTGAAIKAVGGKTFPALQAAADNEKLPNSVRDAARYISRTKHIDENIPIELQAAYRLNGVSDSVAIRAHRQFAAQTAEALEQNKPLSFNEIPFDNASRVIDAPSPSWNIGEQTGSLYRNYTPITQKQEQWLEGLAVEAETFARGQRVFLEPEEGTGGSPQVIGMKSQSPQWFRDLDTTAKEVRKVVDKLKENKPLGVREIKIAQGLIGEINTQREINARQILNYRQRRQEESMRDTLVAGEREERLMQQSEQMESLYRPVSNSMESFRIEAEQTDIDALRDVYNADFQRLLDDNPDAVIAYGDETITLRELQQEIEEDRQMLEAMKICAVG